MSDSDEPQATGPGAGELRIGDPEREAAVRDLSAHRQAGRLTPVEYEDRSVRVSQARTWAELLPMFADLPDPRPAALTGQPATPAPLADRGAALPAPSPERPEAVLPQRWRETIVALAPILAVVLFFTTGSWLWFLAIPVVGILAYGGRGRPPRRR
jgi:hypothetical protein